MTGDKAGRVVWHDLFTSDRQRAMAFYQRVAGWTYQTEHATDFAWGGGEKDFVLALSGDEAGAGFAETPAELSDGWVAYVEVRDVDAAVAFAKKLGGTIVRQPFEVPGVGRNALLRDPLGVIIGISLSRHSFPAPRQQFGVEVYLSDATTFPQTFYTELFGWTFTPARPGSPSGGAFSRPSGKDVAVHLVGIPQNGKEARWIPSLKVRKPQNALREAEELGAKPFGTITSQSGKQPSPLLHHPDGMTFCVVDTARDDMPT